MNRYDTFERVIFTSQQVLQVCLELQFIFEELFPKIPITTRLDEAMLYQRIIYLEYDFHIQIIEIIVNNRKHLALYHLGDETGVKDLSAYVKADVVFRNYYNLKIFSSSQWANKLHWIPNGYRNGLRSIPEKLPRASSQRTYIATFIGWIDNPNAVNNERLEFVRNAELCHGSLNCVKTSGFGSGYSPHLYAHFLEDSVFAPCPAGNAPETIRLFDALEMGCIPISLKHDFLNGVPCLPKPPFPVIDSWSELADKLTELKQLKTISGSSEINDLQAFVSDYWLRVKNYYKFLVAKF